MKLIFQNTQHNVASYEEASKLYLSLKGNSLSSATVTDNDGNELGGMSLDGTVWDGYGTKANVLYQSK